MPASIWLQLRDEAPLREAIASLAKRHGTMPFRPHLTVCGIPPGDPAIGDAAAAYVRESGALPLRVARAGISYSTETSFKAVVIDIENSSELHRFRSELRQITGAPEFEPPHISLLYTIDAQKQIVDWATDAGRLEEIAQECRDLVATEEFVLVGAVVIAADRDWTNIASWRIVRRLSR